MFDATLAPKTAALLLKLAKKKWLKDFYLAGGTALALQYGHRQSVDLDFFSPRPIARPAMIRRLGAVGDFELVNEEQNTVEGILDGVKVSFMTFPYPRAAKTIPFRGSVVLAAPLDIALMKLGAISGRNAKKDFIDLYVYFQRENDTVRSLIAKLQGQFKNIAYDPYHLYKALTYFAEADADAMPKMFGKISWPAVKKFFIQEVGKRAK